MDKKGILCVGSGVSGGEEGARHGPSLMPGGNPKAWPHIAPIFQAICAKVDNGEPCCDWVGEDGSGNLLNNFGKHGGTLVCHLLQDLKVRGSTLTKTKNLC